MKNEADGALGRDIARSVNDVYAALPVRLKPEIRPNGTLEWTILAGFVMEDEHTLKCVAAGVGMKCLPESRLPLQGDMLHDTHAEILARRAFTKWLLLQLQLSEVEEGSTSSSTSNGISPYLCIRDSKYTFRENVKVHLYVSALPCGDASMAYTADHQRSDDAAYYSAIPLLQGADVGVVARGRFDYTRLGALRTKPGRADAGSTISHSCSDKLTTYSLLGVQGGLLANIMHPVYIDTMVIGGVADNREKYSNECHRSLYQRLNGSVDLKDLQEYTFHQPRILFTDVPFYHAKEEVEGRAGGAGVQPATHCANYVAGDTPLEAELVIGGLKNGNFKRRGAQTYGCKYRSRLCKLDIMRHFLSLRCVQENFDTDASTTYRDLKHAETARTYRTLKTLIRTPPSAFADWIVSDTRLSMFDREGVSGGA
ncbi:hypothetical protein E3P99_02102 [Wallemia hederae]|uniref:A to I editase domain-containing protein n=1 Tax=Wallemia hederae TaxID=1540922 RepID=A0A4T0FLK7_9BASI|nr:hypothetical protein E3P99_02102 [Wallemia hederae]